MPLLLLFGSLNLALQGNIPPPVTAPEVVVTGERAADALARCLAAGCPPEQEVEAAMNAAVEHFRSGRYEAARSVLQRAIGRNKKYSARMPGKISDLYATYADVASHYGDKAAYKSGTWQSADVLSENIGKAHPATLAARARVGDMLASIDQPQTADRVYSRTAREAAESGQHRLAALITFRRAWLAFAGDNGGRAASWLNSITAMPGKDPQVDLMVRALRIRLAMRKKDDETVERLLSEWRASPGQQPVVAFSPPLPILQAIPGEVRLNAGAQSDARGVRWADIGYWVRPSGQTADVEIVRPSDAQAWAKPLIAYLKRVRYLPLAEDPGSPGVYKIQRYSVRRSLEVPTGSRIMGRFGPLQIIQTDLTQADPEAVPSKQPY